MNELILIGSPLQMISAICYIETCNNNQTNRDVIVTNNFANAEQLAERFRRYLNVRKVTLIEDEYPDNAPVYKEFIKNCVIFRKRTQHKVFRVTGHSGTYRYNRLVCSNATLLAHDIDITLMDTDSETILIDDGTGSHTGTLFAGISCLDEIISEDNPEYSTSVRIKQKIKHIVNILTINRYVLNIKALYLFNPSGKEYGRYRDALRIMQMNLNQDTMQLIKLVFGISSTNKDMTFDRIYLALPDDADKKCIELEEQLIYKIYNRCPSLVVRMHPRGSSDRIRLVGCQIDEAKDSWEATVGSGLLSSHAILFSLASTAMTSPKNMFGLEPNIVFLYDLLDLPSEFKATASQIASDTMFSYKNKSRVMIPSIESELFNILNEAWSQ